uniref:VWFA domain-containing protein n=1 Tax=Oxyrrhis marina TaxID=2969 RepID=A0A7S4GLK9_OXYMA
MGNNCCSTDPVESEITAGRSGETATGSAEAPLGKFVDAKPAVTARDWTDECQAARPPEVTGSSTAAESSRAQSRSPALGSPMETPSTTRIRGEDTVVSGASEPLSTADAGWSFSAFLATVPSMQDVLPTMAGESEPPEEVAVHHNSLQASQPTRPTNGNPPSDRHGSAARRSTRTGSTVLPPASEPLPTANGGGSLPEFVPRAVQEVFPSPTAEATVDPQYETRRIFCLVELVYEEHQSGSIRKVMHHIRDSVAFCKTIRSGAANLAPNGAVSLDLDSITESLPIRGIIGERQGIQRVLAHQGLGDAVRELPASPIAAGLFVVRHNGELLLICWPEEAGFFSSRAARSFVNHLMQATPHISWLLTPEDLVELRHRRAHPEDEQDRAERFKEFEMEVVQDETNSFSIGELHVATMPKEAMVYLRRGVDRPSLVGVSDCEVVTQKKDVLVRDGKCIADLSQFSLALSPDLSLQTMFLLIEKVRPERAREIYKQLTLEKSKAKAPPPTRLLLNALADHMWHSGQYATEYMYLFHNAQICAFCASFRRICHCPRPSCIGCKKEINISAATDCLRTKEGWLHRQCNRGAVEAKPGGDHVVALRKHLQQSVGGLLGVWQSGQATMQVACSGAQVQVVVAAAGADEQRFKLSFVRVGADGAWIVNTTAEVRSVAPTTMAWFNAAAQAAVQAVSSLVSTIATIKMAGQDLVEIACQSDSVLAGAWQRVQGAFDWILDGVDCAAAAATLRQAFEYSQRNVGNGRSGTPQSRAAAFLAADRHQRSSRLAAGVGPQQIQLGPAYSKLLAELQFVSAKDLHDTVFPRLSVAVKCFAAACNIDEQLAQHHNQQVFRTAEQRAKHALMEAGLKDEAGTIEFTGRRDNPPAEVWGQILLPARAQRTMTAVGVHGRQDASVAWSCHQPAASPSAKLMLASRYSTDCLVVVEQDGPHVHVRTGPAMQSLVDACRLTLDLDLACFSEKARILALVGRRPRQDDAAQRETVLVVLHSDEDSMKKFVKLSEVTLSDYVDFRPRTVHCSPVDKTVYVVSDSKLLIHDYVKVVSKLRPLPEGNHIWSWLGLRYQVLFMACGPGDTPESLVAVHLSESSVVARQPIPAEVADAVMHARSTVDVLEFAKGESMVDNLCVADAKNGRFLVWQLDIRVASVHNDWVQIQDALHAVVKHREIPFDLVYDVLTHFAIVPCIVEDVPQPKWTFQFVVQGASEQGDLECVSEACEVCMSKLEERSGKPGRDTLRLECCLLSDDGNQFKSIPAKDSRCLGSMLRTLISSVPIQVARAEKDGIIVFQDGARQPTSHFSNAEDLMAHIRFGMFEPLLLEAKKNVFVVSSMGKQSTGKSFLLNHFLGTAFDVSGDRCTDGVWLSVKQVGDRTYVALDFEGLGTSERRPQEDMLLSLLNAAVSRMTIFRTDMSWDDFTLSLFRRMQAGADLLPKDDPDLFRGPFVIALKDIETKPEEVNKEFMSKIGTMCRDTKVPFLDVFYHKQLKVVAFENMTNPLYFKRLKDLKKRLEICTPYAGGGAFVLNLKLIMSKIAVLDWTPTSEAKLGQRVSRIHATLPTALCRGGAGAANDLGELVCLQSNAVVLAEPSGDAVVDGISDLGLILAEEKGGCPDFTQDVMAALIATIQAALALSEPGSQHNRSRIVVVLDALVQRRCKKTRAWLQSCVSGLEGKQKIQDLVREVGNKLVMLQDRCKLCVAQCSQCALGCMLPGGHSSGAAPDHNCGTDHVCKHKCLFCDDTCSAFAGHTGKHSCGNKEHVCGEPCVHSGSRNCRSVCTKEPGHSGDEHHCGTEVHYCANKCSLPACKQLCNELAGTPHDVCACKENHCTLKCSFKNCTHPCANDDHFHSMYPDDEGCLCKNAHRCEEKCERHGWCDLVAEQVMGKKTFKGKYNEFEYSISTVEKGVRLPCCVQIPAGQRWLDHEHVHTTTPDALHLCEERCPMCHYVCRKPSGHSGDHRTGHGNMRDMRFVCVDDEQTVGHHRYAAGETAEAELCHLYCSGRGRGHLHVIPCANVHKEGSCAAACTEHRRHAVYKYEPNPEAERDEMTCEAYWKHIGWENPVAAEERAEFRKCNHYCAHASHADDPERSWCLETVMHRPVPWQPGSSISKDGHRFACKHEEIVPLRIVVAIDCSGSMSDGPCPDREPFVSWNNNRLGCALATFDEFMERRSQDSPNDVVTIIGFESRVLVCENVPVCDVTQRRSVLSSIKISGGTNFRSAIAKVVEVLNCYPQVEHGKVLVLFLSDGHSCYPGAEISQLVQLCQSNSWDLRFHALQFPDGEVQAPLRQMVDAVKAMPSKFAQASSACACADDIKLQDTMQGVAMSLGANLGGVC